MFFNRPKKQAEHRDENGILRGYFPKDFYTSLVGSQWTKVTDDDTMKFVDDMSVAQPMGGKLFFWTGETIKLIVPV